MTCPTASCATMPPGTPGEQAARKPDCHMGWHGASVADGFWHLVPSESLDRLQAAEQLLSLQVQQVSTGTCMLGRMQAAIRQACKSWSHSKLAQVRQRGAGARPAARLPDAHQQVCAHVCRQGGALLRVRPCHNDAHFCLSITLLEQACSLLCRTTKLQAHNAASCNLTASCQAACKLTAPAFLQAFREDRTLLAASDFIAEALGQRFVESVPLNLERALLESAPNKPLICLLSPGMLPHFKSRCPVRAQERHWVSTLWRACP